MSISIKKILTPAFVFTIAVAPIISLAQDQDINSFTARLLGIINTIINFLVAVATLIFIFGIVKYIISGGDAEKTADARRFIIFAIVGLVLMIVIWGIVGLIANSLGLVRPAPILNFFGK